MAHLLAFGTPFFRASSSTSSTTPRELYPTCSHLGSVSAFMRELSDPRLTQRTSHNRSTISPTRPDITTVPSAKNKAGSLPPHPRNRDIPLRDRLAPGISLSLPFPQIRDRFQRHLSDSRGVYPIYSLRDRRRPCAYSQHRHILLAIPYASMA